MIHRAFVAPNFRCVALEPDGRRGRWLTYGPSEAEVRRRLSARDWTVVTVKDYDFAEWRQSSATLIAKLPANRRPGEPIAFRERQWGTLKLHLFELFGGKCAYCEAKVRHVASGDVEHYRPKRGVDGDDQHPGYSWLAYEPTNLLPACEGCNRGAAKANRFPVRDGTRARDGAGLAAERPLLLNPYVDPRPADHLEFLDSGHVRGRTLEGETSEAVYRLSRSELREDRLDHLKGLSAEVTARVALGEPVEAVYQALIAELARGDREYSAALLQHVEWLLDELEAAWELEHHAREATIKRLRASLGARARLSRR